MCATDSLCSPKRTRSIASARSLDELAAVPVADKAASGSQDAPEHHHAGCSHSTGSHSHDHDHAVAFADSARARRALAEARKIADVICENGPLSIRALMRMLREIDESYSEADALVKELEIGGPVFASKDAREGPRAFAEKRKPVYRGE